MFSTTPWSPKGKLFKKDSVKVIKTQKSHHMTKFLIICNNPRIASTKTQSIFRNKNVSCERQDSEKTNISWYLNLDIWVFLRLKFVSKLSTFENDQKVMKFHEKLSRKRWQVINFLFHPSLLKIRVKTFSNSSLSTDFTSDILKLTSRFKNSNTQTSFLKVSNNDRTRKLRKLTSS